MPSQLRNDPSRNRPRPRGPKSRPASRIGREEVPIDDRPDGGFRLSPTRPVATSATARTANSTRGPDASTSCPVPSAAAMYDTEPHARSGP